MRMLYREINASDLRGATVADVLVNVEAFFEIVDGSEVIYSESCFPVAELARELARWVSTGEPQAPDFSFSSLSFEDPGAVRIIRGQSGWAVSSIFTPELQSDPISWGELAACIDKFIASVRRDVIKLGIVPDFIDP
ncbi:hypothetical protein HS041_28445 [Planomonospora sp. ID67723]|uniref:DUF7878 domain-containing protein n=1 Tax=Planomonospora sp. ID67723 TaxID=2738134 RepID=UPI0018C42A12|nr:hypothetical protein [Planomonospora sp. ID67723]MBG0831664.1 hypothetical protein [Planomonospora sp. ID67723]